MGNIDKESKHAILITIGFYISFAVIITVIINFKTKNFMDTLMVVVLLIIGILLTEYTFQDVKWKIKKRFWIIFHLIVKSFLICLLMSFISVLLIISLLIYNLDSDTLTKGIFNFLVLFTFISTLAFYRLYLKSPIPDMIEKRIMKFRNGEISLNPISNNKIYRKDIIDKIDFIMILATIFLLGNSTFVSLVPSSIKFDGNPYNTIEFRLLFMLIPVYVQSAYYKLF